MFCNKLKAHRESVPKKLHSVLGTPRNPPIKIPSACNSEFYEERGEVRDEVTGEKYKGDPGHGAKSLNSHVASPRRCSKDWKC